jgi:long-subunit fatty acid transport protein
MRPPSLFGARASIGLVKSCQLAQGSVKFRHHHVEDSSMFSSKKHLALAAVATLLSCNVFAAGYEKAVLWSGHYGGLGGAGTSDVQGAEGLYFNPAGIAMDHVGSQVVVDISPTLIQSSAAINGQHDSKDAFLPPYARIYTITPSDKLAFAIGSYTGGGLKNEYDDINLGAPTHGNYKTDVRAYEFAAGVSYKILPKLKVGVAFRETYATAEFRASKSVGGPNIADQDLRGLKAWGSSYRVGAMWTDSVWGAGVSLRGPTDISATGTNHTLVNNGTLGNTSNGVTVKTQFPLELSAGGHYDFMPHLRGYLEYAYTHYGHDHSVIVDGTGTSAVPQQWSDQHQVRIAADYSEFAWPIRLGYVYTTAVENKSTQIANFAPPSDGHTFTVGTGHAFLGHFQADGAVEYSFSHASGVAGANPPTTSGDYKADVYAVHLGLAYNF